METFKSIKELLNYDFSQLEPQKSNWFIIRPKNGTFPQLKSNQLCKWRLISKGNPTDTPQILFEITPKWLTITITKPSGMIREDFELKQDPKTLIQELFVY
jgi:hypothetical protein